MVRFQTFEQIHNKKNIGSTRIRVHSLLPHWPEAGLYKYGEKPDVLIFQKAYITQDYKFPAYYDGGKKILDICDPDWLDGHLIRETVDAMDAIVTPTQPLADFIKQLTDKPVRVIKDRFEVDSFPAPVLHKNKLSTVVWFGYFHNAETLKLAVASLKKRNLKLIVISERDPQVGRWEAGFEDLYTYYKFPKDVQQLYKYLQEADVAVFPKGYRPVDRFKSENKTIISNLCGLPVARDADELDQFIDPEARNKWVKDNLDNIRKEYDVKKSVEEYKQLIKELK